jgi:hypothetical protein
MWLRVDLAFQACVLGPVLFWALILFFSARSSQVSFGFLGLGADGFSNSAF